MGRGIALMETWDCMSVRIRFLTAFASAHDAGGDCCEMPRREDGSALIFTNQVIGFFKDAMVACARVPGSNSSRLVDAGLTRARRTVDEAVKVSPLPDDGSGRGLALRLPEGSDVFRLGGMAWEKPSECVPSGAWLQMSVYWREVARWDVSVAGAIEEWLGHGRRHGMGRWRADGFGRFDYEVRCRGWAEARASAPSAALSMMGV